MELPSEYNIADLLNTLQEKREFVFLDCARVNSEEHRSLLFLNPHQWLICTEPEQAETFLAEADALRAQGYYLAGWLGYEFGYLLEPSLKPLCPKGIVYGIFGVFDEPRVINHAAEKQSEFVPPAQVSDEETSPFAVENIRTNVRKEEYLQAIDRIKEYIIAGDTYQVNYTLKLLFDFNGSLPDFYVSLRCNQEVSYGAWIRSPGRDIMSFSPELFFRANKDRITVRPMKGTMPRGRDLKEDARQREALRNDLKNRSENVMIVDLLRNDLGRLLHETGGGKVLPRSLFDVEVYDTVLQMTSTVDGIPGQERIPALQNIIPALFPCGSVTGAPKIRTMEIIHELEKESRGVYCGAIGFSGPDESIFNVPIRTVVLEGGHGEMGIGSGIVFDSSPESEWEESLLKARFLTTRQPEFQLIETLLWRPDYGFWLHDEHLARLAGSAEYFLFAYDRDRVEEALKAKSKKFASPMRVRLLLHRSGEIGITATALEGDISPQEEPEITSGASPTVAFSDKPTDPSNVHLFHKTTHRGLYESEHTRAAKAGYYEVFFTNTRGEVTEGSISNIFILKNGRLVTPPVLSGLLPGTFRQYLLNLGKTEEQILTKLDLENADAVFIGNSVRGLVQVKVAEAY